MEVTAGVQARQRFCQEIGQIHIYRLRKAGGGGRGICIRIWGEQRQPKETRFLPQNKQDLWRQKLLATELWCGDREQVAVSGHGL